MGQRWQAGLPDVQMSAPSSMVAALMARYSGLAAARRFRAWVSSFDFAAAVEISSRTLKIRARTR